MYIPFSSIKEGLAKLEEMVQLREKEKDTSFYEVWKRDCNRLADKLLESGADKEDVAVIMSWTTV